MTRAQERLEELIRHYVDNDIPMGEDFLRSLVEISAERGIEVMIANEKIGQLSVMKGMRE